MNAYCCSRPISRLRFFRSGRYRPPVGFRFERPCHRATIDLEGGVQKTRVYMTIAPLAEVEIAVRENVRDEEPQECASVQEREAGLRLPLQDEPHQEQKPEQAADHRGDRNPDV